MRSRGEADITTTALRGASGLAELTPYGRFVATDHHRFEMTWREVRVDDLDVVEWTTTEMAGARTADHADDGVVLVFVIEGVLRCRVGEHDLDAAAGCVLLLAAADRIRFSTSWSTRCLRIAVPADALPLSMRSAATRSNGAIASTGLTDCLASLLQAVLDPARGGSSCPAARAVGVVVTAVIEEAMPTATELRAQLVGFVEAQLQDPGLGPQTVADEFGVSLRKAHSVFNQDGTSLARFIRERRLELVAAQLRLTDRVPPIGTLAEGAGFAGRDQLARAFKAHYGMTIGQYAALGSGPTASNRAR